MYTASDLVEIGTAEDLILSTKIDPFEDDLAVPSQEPSEHFDE